MNTKERILNTSLLLFSTNGFNAVSIRNIADAVGIKSSSLYNHFDSKQDIFDSIIKKYSKHCMECYKKAHSSKELKRIKKSTPSNFSDDDFTRICLEIFKYFFEDKYIILFRKLLSIERFHNKDIYNLYTKIFIDDVLEYHSKVFKLLIDLNIFKKADPNILSLEFYSPVFLLFTKSDKPSSDDMENLKRHAIYFKNSYTLKG